MSTPDSDRRLLVLGASGEVGRELTVALASLGEVIAFIREDCDLTDLASLPERVGRVRPDVIVNAAAYTAVDRAESEPVLAQRVNGEAP